MTDLSTGALPSGGLARADLMAALADRRVDDADWRGARTFSLVYNADDPALEHVLEEVAMACLHENALNPSKFPSLQRMETEVVGWVAGLLHAPEPVGTLTSGGTDSIHLAVKVARDHARAERGIAEPVLVTPDTCHPAFDKAAHTLDVEQVRVPVLAATGTVDVAAMADIVAGLDGRAGLLVASAPNYPYGVVDDVPAVAALAAEHGVLCHVDACLGGMLLPFWERIGRPVAPWDFRVPGVTSISADVHKYGYSIKGASALLHLDRRQLRRQWFVTDAWPGGIYGSPGSAGTRPGPPIAAAWAAMAFLGLDGYDAKAVALAGVTDAMVAGIDAIEGLGVTHPPAVSVLEISSATLDLGAVGDAMDERGWHLDRQRGGLHQILFPAHVHVVDAFLADLAAAAEEVRSGARASAGTAAAYGATPT